MAEATSVGDALFVLSFLAAILATIAVTRG